MEKRYFVGLVVVMCLVAIPAMAQRIVYTGQDPSCHYPDYQTIELTQNMVMWAGGSANPSIAYVEDYCDVGGLLTAAGFTDVTAIPYADLDTTNLSGFDVLYIGYSSQDSGILADQSDAASNVQSYVDAGGNLVGEPMNGPYAWLPYGTAIGGTGDLGGNSVHIVDPGHPVMAGLTDVGLSGWDSSCHADFASPGAAGFLTLTVDQDNGNQACTVVFPAAVPSMGWIGLVALLALLIATGLLFLGRGRLTSGRIAG